MKTIFCMNFERLLEIFWENFKLILKLLYKILRNFVQTLDKFQRILENLIKLIEILQKIIFNKKMLKNYKIFTKFWKILKKLINFGNCFDEMK